MSDSHAELTRDEARALACKILGIPTGHADRVPWGDVTQALQETDPDELDGPALSELADRLSRVW